MMHWEPILCKAGLLCYDDALTSAGGTHIRENILKLIKNVIYRVSRPLSPP